jgi:hypothetical protein
VSLLDVIEKATRFKRRKLCRAGLPKNAMGKVRKLELVADFER